LRPAVGVTTRGELAEEEETKLPMMENERDWRRAVEKTWIVRFPRQHLATFGSTNISYYVVTEPIYQEMEPDKREGVVRTGRVISERPAVVTPTYAMNLQGFSPEAYEYFRHLASQSGPNSAGIMYQYRNQAGKMNIVSGAPSEVAHNISDDLNRRQEDMSVVMVGVDEMWDVALLKFIYEFTSSSVAGNMREFQSRGLLEPQSEYGGAPRAAMERIENLFQEVEQGASPDTLKHELDRWGLFEFYQDRFLDLFRRRR
jgi:hypothetical protein